MPFTIASMAKDTIGKLDRLHLYLTEHMAAHNPPLSDERLAGRLGKHRSSVYRWRVGERRPSDAEVAQIAFALDCNPKDLYSLPRRPSIDAKLKDAPDDLYQAVYEFAVKVSIAKR